MRLKSNFFETVARTYYKFYGGEPPLTFILGGCILAFAAPVFLLLLLAGDFPIWDFIGFFFTVILLLIPFDIHNLHKRVSQKETYRTFHKFFFWSLIGAFIATFIGTVAYSEGYDFETFESIPISFSFADLLDFFAISLAFAPMGAFIAILILSFQGFFAKIEASLTSKNYLYKIAKGGFWGGFWSLAVLLFVGYDSLLKKRVSIFDKDLNFFVTVFLMTLSFSAVGAVIGALIVAYNGRRRKH